MLTIKGENVATPSSAYSWSYNPEQGPVYMDYVARLQGIDRAPFTEPFTYCDLGCGNGMTVNMLAATLPHGEFYGTDINPEHIDNATKTANEIGITNTHFIEASFNALIEDNDYNLPKFDYIALHGIMSWINESVFQEILVLLQKLLKPTGVIYVSYNAMPACARYFPISHFFKTFFDVCKFDESNSEEELKVVDLTLDTFKKISDIPKSYFNSEVLKNELSRLTQTTPAYVVHEYGVETWRPFYFNQISKLMSEANFVYAGSTTLEDNYWQSTVNLSKEMKDILEKFSSNVTLIEQLGDYIVNKRFRRDIYMQASTQPSTDSEVRNKLLSEVYVHTRHPDNWKSDDMRNLEFPENLSSYSKRILEIAAVGSHKIADIISMDDFKDCEPNSLLNVIEEMIGKCMLILSIPPEICRRNRETVKKYNDYVSEYHFQHDLNLYLISPVLGLGLGVERAAQLMLYAKQNYSDEKLLDAFKKICAEKNISYTKGGTSIDNQSELDELMSSLCDRFESNLLPYMKELEIV